MNDVGNFLTRGTSYIIVLDVNLSVRLYADTPHMFHESIAYNTKSWFGYKFVEY